MYSSGYSQVNKFSPEARKKMQHRSKGKSCGYYMRIIFFFSSLIQSLIIVSLVLFLIYGKTQDSASATRIQDLEESFSRLSIENVALRQQRQNLTNKLNVTVTEKARNDWDLARLRYLSNISIGLIQDFERKIQQCTMEAMICGSRNKPQTHMFSQSLGNRNCDCGHLERENAKLELVRSNFTQTTKLMRMEMDQLVKERDNFGLEAIHLRRNKSMLQMELQSYRERAKDEFHHSLSSVTNVSRAFLQKIESLFPRHIAFQLTCPKQREHLEQIHSNCTSLSREVEDRLQGYLNSVGDQVSNIQAENNRLKAENTLLSEDYRRCSQNHMHVVKQNKQEREELQRKHDNEKEKLLVDKVKLNGEIEVLDYSVKHKSKEIDHLTEQVRQLNTSCMLKSGQSGSLIPRTNVPNQPGWNLLNGGKPSSSNFNQFVKPASGGLGPNFGIGSAFNKPASTGTGSLSSSYLPSGSSSSLGNTGGGYNKPASTGTGSSRSSYSPSGSSSSLGNTGGGYNKPASTGTGSSSSSYSSSGSSSSLSRAGLGINKSGSSGGSYSSSGSTGSSSGHSSAGTSSTKSGVLERDSTGVGSTGLNTNLGSSGIGSNKPTTNGKTSGFGIGSSSSSGSSSRSGSTGLSWLGLGSSSLGQSNTQPQKPSSGGSYGGNGLSLGGRTSGLGAGSGSASQHIRELQRMVNPSSQQERPELSRMLG